MQYHEFRAMNTSILMAGEGAVTSVQTGFSLAQKFIEESEKRFTRFSETSELSRLNRSAGEWFQASQDMYEVISLALRLHRQTEGLFDPAILNALELAGYDRSMDEIRMYGSAASPVLVRPKLYRFGEIRLDPERCRVFVPQGMRIDLGGLAKGWIAERAALVLGEWANPCAVDAGGDGFMIGLPPEGFWRVSLEDPLEPTRGLAVLNLPPGGVATSTIAKRRWKQGDKERHHLIDPRTQQPAETEWLSMTVIAPHVAEAEVYAKSLLIGGSNEINRVTSLSESNIEFIAVDRRKKLWGSRNSRAFLQN